MASNTEITPNVLEQIHADYQKALEERRKIMIRQSKEWSQREIAKYWRVDVARVNRILNRKGKSTPD
jgi:hypothetical protein